MGSTRIARRAGAHDAARTTLIRSAAANKIGEAVRSGGTGKAEPAKLPGAGIWSEQCPGKCAAEKGQVAEISEKRRQKQT
jgi:hypothetical protein